MSPFSATSARCQANCCTSTSRSLGRLDKVGHRITGDRMQRTRSIGCARRSSASSPTTARRSTQRPSSRFASSWGGITQKFTRAYRPQTNGRAERFIQSVLRELAYGGVYGHSDECRFALPCRTTSTTCTVSITASAANHLCPVSQRHATASDSSQLDPSVAASAAFARVALARISVATGDEQGVFGLGVRLEQRGLQCGELRLQACVLQQDLL